MYAFNRKTRNTEVLLEDHIRNHMPRNSKSAQEAAEDVIEVVKTYLRGERIGGCLI
jgi:DNA-binding FrmR family transcriptional regulator